MAYAVKTKTKCRAWELGAGSEKEREMIRRGRIAAHPGGIYEIFSQEAKEGSGQKAKAGDFFKEDNRGYPYPIEREYFLENHRHTEGDWYEQAARPMKIWRAGDPESEEPRFLKENGILFIHPEDPKHYFSALMWGTEETAPADAVILFFDAARDAEGKITGINFNFIVSDYFREYYRIIPE